MHSVQSEVAAELEREPDERAVSCCVLRVTERQATAELVYDSDGDLIVPRKRQRMRATAAEAQSTTRCRLRQPMTAFALEAKDATTWQQAGSQLWRAAFLLAEFVLSSPVG